MTRHFICCVIVSVVLALSPTPSASAAPSSSAADGGLKRVMSVGGGVVLACLAKTGGGFVGVTWWLENTRREDVVKATAKTRSVEFGTDVWEPWGEQMSYRTGWINPGRRKSIVKESTTAPASEMQTKITVVSREDNRRQTRTFAWTQLDRF